MSSFKNVTDTDLELRVDGRPYTVPAGGSVKIPDEFDSQLAEQPAWAPVKSTKSEAVSVNSEETK